MKSESTTIKDIALHLNISASTVSRALNNHPEVSPQTRKAVLEAAKKLNYHPNAFAIGLVKNRTRTIGVLMPDITQPFYSSAISGIEDVAVNQGYYVMICQSDESFSKEVNLLHMFNRYRVDGIIVCPATTTDSYQHLEEIVAHTSLVQFDRVIDSITSHKVVSDDYQGAYQAVSHLVKQGYQRVAHIAGPNQLSVSKNRMKGYIEALRDAGHPVNEQYIRHCSLTKEHKRQCASELLELKIPPDAIFTVNDPTAIEVMYVAKQKLLIIPEDIAIVGFDDQAMTPYLDPALTTVGQPSFAMGQTAARLLIDQIETPVGVDLQYTTETFSTQLVVRGSS